jgi:hypothetical protein
MNGPIQRAVRSVQLAVMATPTRSLVDALAAARRAARPTLPISPAGGASIAAVAAA